MNRAVCEAWLARFRADPLAWPFREAMARLEGTALDVATLAIALDPLAGVHFAVSAKPLRKRRGQQAPRDVTAYDRSIVEQRVVPTRGDNAHDLANALAWAVFPASKTALHARQLVAVREAHARASDRPWTRSPEGDALAMLDEGGIPVVVNQALAEDVSRKLLAGDDEAIAEHAARGETLGIVFGHGLLEHLGRERDASWRPMAGMAVALPFAGDPRRVPLADVDLALAARIADPASFRLRTGYGIGSATPSVLGRGS